MISIRTIKLWFDSDSAVGSSSDTMDWHRVIPFIGVHLACLGVIWVGVSPVAVAALIFSYLLRMFAITAFYHRYFSHRTFKTSRAMQFLFALLGATATQRGPLWWASHHRQHHRSSDRDGDPHSPREGFWWSHMGWFLSRKHFTTDYSGVKDLARYPELRFLDRYDLLVPVIYAAIWFLLGEFLASRWPGLNTSGWQLLVWGYFIATVVLAHVTVLINSLAHSSGSRRYATADDSRNNWWLALLTLGEGWHNNHHHFPGAARQGFFWWEVDLSYYGLTVMKWLGLVWDLKPVPTAIRNRRLINRQSST